MAKKNSLIARILIPPALVIGGIMSLWENEGRFDYYKAARDATVIESPDVAPAGATVAMTAELDTGIAIPGEYVEDVLGYHVVSRSAEIYSWTERRDDDGTSSWSKGWHSSLESNSRNGGLRQTLRSATLYPPRYRLGDLEIAPANIHFADSYEDIAVASLPLSDAGRGQGLFTAGGYLFKGEGGDRLGDERVSYRGVPNSAIASYFGLIGAGVATGKQHAMDRSLVSGIIGNDGILHHLVNGGREEALHTIKADLQRLKWLVRLGGTAAVVFGIFVFFSGFVNLLYRIPILGSLVSTGVLLVSVVIGFSISLLVILASLAFHEPLLVLLPVALIVTVVVLFQRRAKAARENVRASLRERRPGRAAGLTGAGAPAAGAAPSDTRTVEALFISLATLALADGTLDEKENRFLVRWGRGSGIARARMKELFALAKREHGPVHAADREDLVLLTCLAMADGTLSVKELSGLIAIGKRIGLSVEDVREIIVAVESDAAAPA